MPEILTQGLPPLIPAHDSHQIYNGLDACITLEVWERLREELDREIRPEDYKLKDDYYNALSWQRGARINYSFERAMQGPALEMMLRGLLVDQPKRWQAVAKLEERIEKLQNILDEFSFAVWQRPLNSNSPKQLKELFYSVMKLPEQHIYVKGQRKISTSRDALEKLSLFYHAEPFTTCIIRIRDLTKKVSVLRTEVDPDSRMRTSYNVAGPETGRWSSSSNVHGGGTNLQNITEELRRIFIADPGYKLAYIDLSQAESRILAFLCWILFGKSHYLDACESGDLHTTCCRLIWPGLGWTGDLKKDKEIGEQDFYHHHTYRYMTKRCGHGSNYYGKPFTIARQIKMPEKIVFDFQSNYFSAFPELPEYHRWCAKQLQLHGQISTPLLTSRIFFGRVNDDATLREAIAHVPQHMVGVLLNLALWRVWHQAREPAGVQILAQVHDAILIQYKEEREEEVLSSVLPLMATPLHHAGRSMTIPSDILVGWNWSKYYDEAMAANDVRKGRKPKPLNKDGLRGRELGTPDRRKRTEDPTAKGLARLIS